MQRSVPSFQLSMKCRDCILPSCRLSEAVCQDGALRLQCMGKSAGDRSSKRPRSPGWQRGGRRGRLSVRGPQTRGFPRGRVLGKAPVGYSEESPSSPSPDSRKPAWISRKLLPCLQLHSVKLGPGEGHLVLSRGAQNREAEARPWWGVG